MDDYEEIFVRLYTDLDDIIASDSLSIHKIGELNQLLHNYYPYYLDRTNKNIGKVPESGLTG